MNVASRAAFGLLLGASGLVACHPGYSNGNRDGGGNGNGNGNPPQVSLVVPDNDLASTGLPMTLNVAGCAMVQSANLYNGNQLLKAIPTSQNPSNFALQATEVAYDAGIAIPLSLVAKVTCDDGRTGDSLPQSAQFFPVQQVVQAANGGQVLPDIFFSEGSGTSLAFYGCSQDPTTGVRSLVKIGPDGSLLAKNASLPFPCSLSSVFTDKNATTGLRWMLEPGVGAFTFDSSLNTYGAATGNFKYLGVGPNGDAVVWENVPALSNNFPIKRIRASNGAVVWSNQPAFSAAVNQGVAATAFTNPIITNNNVFVPLIDTDTSSFNYLVWIEWFPYDTGNTHTDYLLLKYPYVTGGSPNPPAAFSSTGQVLYLIPPPSTAGYFLQQAYSTTCSCAPGTCAQQEIDCTTVSRLWSTQLTGFGVLSLPYAGGTRVAAVASQALWLLDSSNGNVLNAPAPGGGGPLAIIPSGSLVANSVQPGIPGSGSFYLLNGPVGAALPTEIVGIDSAERGELFRYQLYAGTLMVAVDASDQPWMRIGGNLVKPFSLSYYRSRR